METEQDSERSPTPSEVLIKCLEKFGEEEPEGVCVIFTTGDAVWTYSNVRRTQLLGMLEMAKDYVLRMDR